MRHFYLKTFNSNCNTIFNIILRLFQNFNVDMRTSGENLNSMHTYSHAVQHTHVMFATSRSNMRHGMGSNATHTFQPTNNIMHAFVNEVIDNVEVLEVGYTHLQSTQEAVHNRLCGLYGYRQHRQESVRRSLYIKTAE